jgi:hypothetical protein
MTTTSVATRSDAPSRGTWSRAGLSVVIVLGPLSIGLLRAILPYSDADDPTTIATKISQHRTAESAVGWLALLAFLTLVPGAIAVGQLAARRSPRLGTWGLALTTAGYACLAVIAAVDFAAVAALEAGVPPSEVASLVEGMNGSPVAVAGTVIYVVGHVAGLILLGVALLRAHVIPAWAAWAIIVSAPLHLIFAVAVPAAVPMALAWLLTAVGFAMAARVLTRPEP